MGYPSRPSGCGEASPRQTCQRPAKDQLDNAALKLAVQFGQSRRSEIVERSFGSCPLNEQGLELNAGKDYMTSAATFAEVSRVKLHQSGVFATLYSAPFRTAAR